MTRKVAEKLPHNTRMLWRRYNAPEEDCEGRLVHDIAASWIDWDDGQRTYTSDDAAMKYVVKPA